MNSCNTKIFLTLLLLTLFKGRISAQSPFVPFPEGEAAWHVLKLYPYTNIPEHWQYMYHGDTTLNGFVYHKISYKVEGVNLGTGNLEYDDNGDIGYLRQDSLARKVYYIQRDFPDEEYLLYDFDLQVGDFYPHTFTHSSDSSLTLTSIDSVLVGNSYRRVFVFRIPNVVAGGVTDTAVRLIEGIGNDAGLFTDADAGNCFELCWKLACFQQDGETLYSPNDIGGAWTGYPFGYCHLVGVNEIENRQQNISMQPNPVVQGENVNFTIFYETQTEISISDLFGNIIWSKKFLHESSAKIPTNNFSKGIYVAKISVDDKFLFTQKLVVQ